MSYSVYFFALDAKCVANQFVATPKALLNRMEQSIRDQRRFSEDDIQSTVAKAGAVCLGEIPKNCDAEYFHALCWLAEVAGEKITIGSFLGFRHGQFLRDIGVWPLFLRSGAPFAVPLCAEPPPQVGFMDAAAIGWFAITGFDRLPTSNCAEVNYARQEFQEVVESLAEDKLDLLAVLL